MFEGVFRTIDLSSLSLSEMGVKRFTHPTEQGRRYGSSTELAISYFFDPAGHPATSDKGIVLLGLKIGSVFDGLIVQPDVRDVKLCESPTQTVPGCRLPGNAK